MYHHARSKRAHPAVSSLHPLRPGKDGDPCGNSADNSVIEWRFFQFSRRSLPGGLEAAEITLQLPEPDPPNAGMETEAYPVF